jgi:hypothetical protein
VVLFKHVEREKHPKTQVIALVLEVAIDDGKNVKVGLVKRCSFMN